MSRDQLPQTCDACREEAFEYRRDDVSGPERDRIEEHLEGCERCREYFDRVDTLVSAAAETDPAPGEVDSDAMFDAITDQIREREEGDESVRSPDDQTEQSSQVVELGPSPGRLRQFAIAVAALIAGLVLGAVLTQLLTGGRSSTSVADRSDAGDDRGAEQRVAERGSKPSTGENDGGPRFADFREVAADARTRQVDEGGSGDTGSEAGDELRMFASSNAEWSVDREGETVIELERGRLLVEFLGAGTGELEVRAPNYTVRVVGTVFFVSAEQEPPRTGVLFGEVEVESDEGDTVRLREGEEIGASLERRTMPESRREVLEQYVDLAAHRREAQGRTRPPDETADRSDGRRAGQPEADGAARAEPPAGGRAAGSGEGAHPTVPERADGDRPGELESIRRRADRAAEEGKFSGAAAMYRDYLDRAPSGTPGVGPVHLDLANLYIHRLDVPERAVSHLRTYLRKWPDDVAAPSAREELCRITRTLEGYEPDCDRRTDR